MRLRLLAAGWSAMFGVFIHEQLAGGCNLIRWRREHARVETGRAGGAARRCCERPVSDAGAALGFVEETVARPFGVIAGRRFDVVRASLVESEVKAF